MYDTHKRLLSFHPFLSFYLISFCHKNVFSHLFDWPVSQPEQLNFTVTTNNFTITKQLSKHLDVLVWLDIVIGNVSFISGLLWPVCQSKSTSWHFTFTYGSLKSNVLKVTWLISAIPFTICHLVFFHPLFSFSVDSPEVSMETSLIQFAEIQRWCERYHKCGRLK